MKISLMCPTRKRTHELVYALASFINHADDNKNIEYIFLIDPDDNETITALEKIVLMCYAQGVKLICHVMDKHYGYAELEEYFNAAGKIFTGECLFLINDDLLCIERGWDTKMRSALSKTHDTPAWVGIVPINEWWKGNITFSGINRKWYEIVGRVSGTRAIDGYLPLVGKGAGIEPTMFDIKLLHLQRGKESMHYDSTQADIIYGLPDDGLGGWPTRKNNRNIEPKYVWDSGMGKDRLEEDIVKLKMWFSENTK